MILTNIGYCLGIGEIKMKKFIALCLVLFSIVSLCACGGEKQNNTQTNETSQQVDNGPSIESEARKYIPMFYNRTGHKERWDFIDENENCFPFLNQSEVQTLFNDKIFLTVYVGLLIDSEGNCSDDQQWLYKFKDGIRTQLGHIDTNSSGFEKTALYESQYNIEDGYYCETNEYSNTKTKYSVQKIIDGYYLIVSSGSRYIYGESDENGKLIYDCSESNTSSETIDSSITLEKWAKNNPNAQALLKSMKQTYGNGSVLEVTIEENTLIYSIIYKEEFKNEEYIENAVNSMKSSLQDQEETWIENCNKWARMSSINDVALKYQYVDGSDRKFEIVIFNADVDLEKEKTENEEDFQELIDEKKEANAKPQIGMTAEQVRKGKWGYPDKINKHTYSWGVQEQWVYDDYGYVYLRDGIVTSITEEY